MDLMDRNESCSMLGVRPFGLGSSASRKGAGRWVLGVECWVRVRVRAFLGVAFWVRVRIRV